MSTYAVTAKLDDWGLPAWIAVMVVGFIVWWPIGLGVLAYLMWSGRMAAWRGSGMCGRHARDRMRESAMWWRHQPSSGNHAFDEYRTETLRRLEEEQREFKEFLERLRFAKDKTEFDQFMAERRNRSTGPQAPQPPPPQG